MDQSTKLVLVTVKMAHDFINRNAGNRTLRDGVVEKYAHDMKTGNWTECPVPISFYENGDIADGQHRLWAIIESMKPQHFYLVHDLSREAGLNIDTGIGRTLVDNARISGLDKGLSNALIAVAMFYDAGRRPKKGVSNSDRLEIVQRHREPCDWAIAHGPTGKGLRSAPILAAIARAYQAKADQERLIKFGKVLSTGLADGRDDHAAVALRNYMLSLRNTKERSEQRDLFLKAQNAIWYFLRRKPLGVLRVIKEETFPLKGANTRAAA